MIKNQKKFILVLTIAVALILSGFIGYTTLTVRQREMQICFDDLDDASKQLAAELYNSLQMDRTILTALATIISNEENSGDARLSDIMKTYNCEASYMSYIELLRPDNTMLNANGAARDVSEYFNFAEECKKGKYISNIEQSTLNPNEKVIRSAVPVVQHGKIACMLYGVVRLSDLAEKYKTNIYDGHAYVYLVDGNNGDFLLDTWHQSLGNIRDFSKRKMVKGFSFEEAYANMGKGISGEMAFVSKTTGSVLYMSYEPTGINNWSVILTVEEEYAQQERAKISESLYGLVRIMGVICFLYIACVLFYFQTLNRHIYMQGFTDQTTSVNNRNSYEEYIANNQERQFAAISCIYIDANGLHEINNKYGHQAGDEMLRMIADALKREFKYKEVFRIGGDEFVVLTETDSEELCNEKMQRVSTEIEAHDYHIAYGLAYYQNEIGVNRITHEADEKMLENKRQYYRNHERRQRK